MIFLADGILEKWVCVLETCESCMISLLNRADKVKEVNEEQQGHRDSR